MHEEINSFFLSFLSQYQYWAWNIKYAWKKQISSEKASKIYYMEDLHLQFPSTDLHLEFGTGVHMFSNNLIVFLNFLFKLMQLVH